jgi:hypothetical protein
MGGRAFKELTRRVTKAEVELTSIWLDQSLSRLNFGGRPLQFCLLGSAGRKETSGDIDFNIDIERSDINAATIELQNLLGPDHVWPRWGNSQIFCAVPISGHAENGYVQADFMFGDFNWQQFAYGSPGEDSAYKGLFRTELIKALVAYNSDWTLVENGELIARVGPTFFDSKGLIWRYRHRPFGKKDPTKRIKAFEELSKADFMKLYPDAKPASHDRMIDPKQVVNFILWNSFMVDCYSYESIWKRVCEIYTEEDKGHISRLYFERLNSLRVEIPQTILDEHNPTPLR